MFFLKRDRKTDGLFVVICLIVLYVVISMRAKQSERNVHQQTKYILLWNKLFTIKNWEIETSDSPPNEEYTKILECPHSCVITSNRSFLDDLTKFDAIMFHIAQYILIDKSFEQLKRNPKNLHQKYVFGMKESPENSFSNFFQFNNFFNWTLSYRLDSDVVWPYGRVYDIELNKSIAPSRNPQWRPVIKDYFNDNYLKITQNKKKFAAWFVSNCNAKSGRDQLVKELQKHIQVDIYGSCGNLSCPRFTTGCENLLKDYKFYFSFENSLCDDYVTEKLFANMQQIVIPVVFGGADYNKFVPTHSYINANDFKTVKDLATYLLYLNENPNEYIKYFWWKEYYTVFTYPLDTFCDLCKKLHETSATTDVSNYNDIKEWWFWRKCHDPLIKFLM